MSFLGRWNGVFYFGPLLLITSIRLLENIRWAAETALTILSLLAWVLVISTVTSILDRAIAPFNIQLHSREEKYDDSNDNTKEKSIK